MITDDLWNRWDSADKTKRVLSDAKFASEAQTFHERQSSNFYALNSNLPKKVGLAALHELRVVEHYMHAVRRHVQFWVAEKASFEQLMSSIKKWFYVLIGLGVILAVFQHVYPLLIVADQETQLWLSKFKLERSLFVLIVLAALLYSITWLFWENLERYHSMELSRMMDAIVELTGCSIPLYVIRHLHDYADTPVFEGYLNYVKALVLAKYFTPHNLDELTEKTFSNGFSQGEMYDYWNVHFVNR